MPSGTRQPRSVLVCPLAFNEKGQQACGGISMPPLQPPIELEPPPELLGLLRAQWCVARDVWMDRCLTTAEKREAGKRASHRRALSLERHRRCWVG
jgi:hypothetical protein